MNHCNYITHKVFSVFTTGRCLVGASTEFPNCPQPQLTAFHFSQPQLSTTQPQLKRVRVRASVMLRPTVNQPVCLGVKHSSAARGQVITAEQLRVCWCGVPSLTIAVGPRQRRVPRALWPCFTVWFENPQIWRARSLYLYPPGTGWPSYTPDTQVKSQSQSHIATDGQSISRSWRRAPSTGYLLLFDSYGLVFVGRPLWREDGCLLYMLLASPA
jgi:hypothetical protein